MRDFRENSVTSKIQLQRFPLLTVGFVALNVGLFVGMRARGPIDQDTLIAAGAKATSLVVDVGQLWRLLTANLLHETTLHIAFNLFVLSSVGWVLENIFRAIDYLVLLLAAALGSTLVSLWALPEAVTVGASGVVYGALAALVVVTLRYRRLFSERLRRVLGEATVPTVLVFMSIGFTSRGVDNWAHLGGLIAGAFATFLLTPRAVEPVARVDVFLRRWVPRVVIVGAVLVVAGGGRVWMAGGPRFRMVREELLGIEAPVPRHWRRETERLGQVTFSNGLSGLGRAFFRTQTRGSAGQSPEAAVEAYVQRSLRPEEKAGAIREITLQPARPVRVGGVDGQALEGGFIEEGRAVRFRVVLIRRGEVSHELIYQWSADYPAYERLVEQMVERLRWVEPRGARGRQTRGKELSLDTRAAQR